MQTNQFVVTIYCCYYSVCFHSPNINPLAWIQFDWQSIQVYNYFHLLFITFVIQCFVYFFARLSVNLLDIAYAYTSSLRWYLTSCFKEFVSRVLNWNFIYPAL